MIVAGQVMDEHHEELSEVRSSARRQAVFVAAPVSRAVARQSSENRAAHNKLSEHTNSCHAIHASFLTDFDIYVTLITDCF